MTPPLRARRRRGRPKESDPLISVNVRLPQAILDAFCRRALVSHRHLSAVLREILVRDAKADVTK